MEPSENCFATSLPSISRRESVKYGTTSTLCFMSGKSGFKGFTSMQSYRKPGHLRLRISKVLRTVFRNPSLSVTRIATKHFRRDSVTSHYIDCVNVIERGWDNCLSKRFLTIIIIIIIRKGKLDTYSTCILKRLFYEHTETGQTSPGYLYGCSPAWFQDWPWSKSFNVILQIGSKVQIENKDLVKRQA